VNYDTYDAAEGVLPVGDFPWPPAEGESLVGAAAATWRGASLSPRSFFAALPAEGSLGAALLYYVPLGILVSGANLLWTMTSDGMRAERDAVLSTTDATAISPLLQFLFSPLILLVSLFLAAGVVHLLLKAFGGVGRGYGFTVRLFAFAYSPQLLAVVPVVGAPVGFVWMVVVAIIGVREGHGTTTARAAAAVLIPVIIALFFLALAAFLAVTGRLLLR
jgi:hypothetical protein